MLLCLFKNQKLLMPPYAVLHLPPLVPCGFQTTSLPASGLRHLVFHGITVDFGFAVRQLVNALAVCGLHPAEHSFEHQVVLRCVRPLLLFQ